MSNPFESAPQSAPAIPDAAAQQFAPQQAQPNAFQQAAAQAPGQPWTPEQHQAYGQAQGQPGYAPAPQQAPAQFAQQPVNPTGTPAFPANQQFAPQQAPQAAYAPAPAPQYAPAPAPAQPSFVPQGATPGVPAFAQPGGQISPDLFNAPAAGGVGRRPGWRDLQNRFVLVRVTARGIMRDTYDKKAKEPTFDANIAVLDGGQIVMSPKMGDPTSVAEVFSDKVPCVIDGMIVTSKGLQNRFKTDFTRGRIVREPINDLQKHLKEVPGDEPLWWKLEAWLAQDPKRVHDFKQSIMWSIVDDPSPEANALTAAFLQTPEGQAFCK